MGAVEDLRALGYTVGVAYGDAQPEHDRLAEVEAAAEPGAVSVKAQDFADSAAIHAKRLGLKGNHAVSAIAEAYQRAFESFDEQAQSAVEHQRRALEIAEGMATVYRIEGHGLSLLVADDDEATLATLLDEDAHAERAAQAAEG